MSLRRRAGAWWRAAPRSAAGQAQRIEGLISILRSGTQRRHALSWLRSLQRGYLLKARSPWLTFDAIEFVDRRIGSAARVFEYGSGGSTLFWLDRGAHCTSIEHDAEWYDEVGRRLSGGAQIDYRLVLPEFLSGAPPNPADPHGYGTADAALRDRSFERYVSQIDRFPDAHFDVVLIDGRSRPSCVKHSAAKVKGGGMLIVDNSEVPYYLERTRAYLRGYEEHAFHGAIPTLPHWTRTSVFVRTAKSR